ncbi:efflux transporter outer membrane subunit [Luteolibacter yonseiensis]|uniref:Efflux transporter outer membrane subunit n=1 Tax=Luteolibacter yonseiensis TaxID=1144680 RepID=A0A934VB27_9BACT|nr:efflux transporter outer membrane subunit [Luteolibacter yonseiensis]MBK1814974.1 efflux transporter outer membrane subunit [Luteolibacter yonseiensis]
MKSARFFFISSVALIGLSGCGVTSTSSHANLPLPADWKNSAGFPVASATRDLSRWWGRFNDPTLNRVISDALKNSPDIASASARVRESRAQRNAVASSLFPSLSGGVTGNANASDRDRFGRDSDSSYSAGLNASWEADLFGKNRSSVEAASAQVGATQENFHSVQASLAAETASAYASLRTNEARLAVLKKNITTREETARLAGWRNQAGEADSLEATQAQSSLETARAAIPSLEQAISQGKNQLAFLAGRSPGELDSLLSKSHGAPVPPSSLAIGIPADVLRQRPDVRLAGYQLLAAAASTRATEATRYPSLNLSGSLGLNSATASKLLDPEAATASLVAGITSPIFDAGRIKSNIEAASASEEQAIQTYRTTVLNALRETEDALIACRRSAERLELLETATRLARESDETARQRYESGEIDFLDVLDSQRTLLSLEDNLLTTRTDRTTAYIRLYQALGGGWSSGS